MIEGGDAERRAVDEGLLLAGLHAALAGQEPLERRDVPVVALVGSAGGLDAVSRVLARLPADFGAAVLVLLHQAPDVASRLAHLLGRECALPVVDARDGMSLLPGVVLVVPPGRHLLVTPRRRVLLIPSGSYPPSRPSADLLLATLATSLGPDAIAVILSGGGTDGATGASAVHRAGGTVLATDESSSASFSMPLAAISRDGTVDRVLDLDEVGGVLAELVTEGPPVAPDSASVPTVR